MDEFLENLRNQAIYFRLTDTKNGEGVGIDNIIATLQSIMESYLAFVDIEYEKVNTQTDKKKLAKVIKALKQENALMVVDLKFESCGMALSPNTNLFHNPIPSISNQLEWKKDTFAQFKEDVIKGDFNNTDYLERITKSYTPNQRQRIFKPFVDDVINKKGIGISFGIGSNKCDITPQKPAKKSYAIIVPPTDSEIKKKEEVSKKVMASVEIITGGNIIRKPKVLELFDEMINPIIPIESISSKYYNYKLRCPIFCELIHEDNSYTIENIQLGIYASGETKGEAITSFKDEFDYIYNRYNAVSDDKLTDDCKWS